jgi:hypothetical protein
MLGRLQIPIEKCLELYEDLAGKVFVKRLKQAAPFKWISAEMGGTWFNGKDLEDAVKDILREKSIEVDAPFRATEDPECKV